MPSSALASAEPVPGGGSASAVAAGLGAGLVAMVASLSTGRPKYAAARRPARLGRRHRDRPRRPVPDDRRRRRRGVRRLCAAMKLPRETDEEIAARTAALQAAARGRAEVPLTLRRGVPRARRRLGGARRSQQRQRLERPQRRVAARRGRRPRRRRERARQPAVGRRRGSRAGCRSGSDDLVAEVERLASATREIVGSGDARDPIAPAEARDHGDPGTARAPRRRTHRRGDPLAVAEDVASFRARADGRPGSPW